MGEIVVRGLSKSFGPTSLFEQINFDVNDGEFMVIVGPSGCGKSTLLRVIAGVESVGTGTVVIGGREVTREHPGDRDIAMVFQDYALYPHMTVADNLGFGLRARRLPRAEVESKVARIATLLGLEAKLQRKPAQLSGGERQRVALGRAMIREPRAYLMDEPLSNLDAALRAQMRTELLDFHHRIATTILYVTHDQVEAMTMGQRIAVMNHGRFEQVGAPRDVYRFPDNTFVAKFLGSPRMNIFPGVASSEGPSVVVAAQGLTWRIPAGGASALIPREILVGFRPESVEVAVGISASSDLAGGEFDRAIDLVEDLGNEAVVHLRATAQDEDRIVCRLSPADLQLARERSRFRIPVGALHLFSREGASLFHGADLVTGVKELKTDAR